MSNSAAGRLLAIVMLVLGFTSLSGAQQSKPNIVYILCDDLGIGDLHSFNPNSKIPTPQTDRLAAQSMRFTDAHSTSAVCTPSRYSILTGRYSWRSRLQSGVLNGYSKHLIEEGRLTVPMLLKQNGYTTACLGKWHLGMDWSLKDGASGQPKADGSNIDFAAPIAHGPTTLGFDEYFGIAASLDMPPYVFIHNDRAVEVPTVQKSFKRKGLAAADFEAVDVVPTLVKHAQDCIASHATAAHGGAPFFLYVPLTSPHTPLVPGPEWRGKSILGEYGDFVMQTDDAIGKIVAALDANGLTENTLLIVTSDNGCAPYIGVHELEAKGHFPSIDFRGYKADIFEGGHRIPLIVRWPGVVKAGSTSDQTVCLASLMATCAEIVGAKLPDNTGEDSFSMLHALRGEPAPATLLVNHSINGSFAIRQGRWKLALCPDSGGWGDPTPAAASTQPSLPPVQLFDMQVDPGEKTNVYAEHPEVVEQLKGLLEKWIADGRTTTGPKQANNGTIRVIKKYEPRSATQPQAD